MKKPSDSHLRAGRGWLFELGKEVVDTVEEDLEAVIEPADAPPGFPASIPVDTITFRDWSQFFEVPNIPVARIASAEDVVAVCNWAAKSGYTVRAVGHSHNWSPILLTESDKNVMLVDTTKLNECSFKVIEGMPQATFGTGVSMFDATAYLETLDNGGASPAPGYSFPHMPAPGNLSLGGVLAIGAHGTLVPSNNEKPNLAGGLSNLIVGFQAVITDPQNPAATYELQNFDRTDTDAAAFLVHLGRAFITSVTLRVIPNYYCSLSCLFPTAADMFADPSAGELPPQAFANLLDEYGRVEVLWFPYNDETFAQCNKVTPTLGDHPVKGPYNYPWMNNITGLENALIKGALFADPELTPYFTKGELLISMAEQYGAVLNGTARDLEIYLKDTTLRVSLFGWALQIPRAEAQQVANQFYVKVVEMVAAAKANGQYPVNAAMEIRCTTVDLEEGLGVPNAVPPALAATHAVSPGDAGRDTVIWLNLGTIPKTPGAFEFFTELETWMIQTWGSSAPNYLRPEWSKAWAWTDEGPWLNTAVLAEIRASYNQSADSPLTFDWAAKTLASYDKANLFTNPFLTQLFGA